jgi:hypothetical protein
LTTDQLSYSTFFPRDLHFFSAGPFVFHLIFSHPFVPCFASTTTFAAFDYYFASPPRWVILASFCTKKESY